MYYLPDAPQPEFLATLNDIFIGLGLIFAAPAVALLILVLYIKIFGKDSL